VTGLVVDRFDGRLDGRVGFLSSPVFRRPGALLTV